MFACTYIFSSIILNYSKLHDFMYYNQYGNLFILISLLYHNYYSDGIYVEYLVHMTYIRTIKMFILYIITTHEYVY